VAGVSKNSRLKSRATPIPMPRPTADAVYLPPWT